MARKKGNRVIKKLRKEVIPVARKFDVEIRNAVEEALGIPFNDLDTTKFSVDEEIGLLFYDGLGVAVVIGDNIIKPIIDGKVKE